MKPLPLKTSLSWLHPRHWLVFPGTACLWLLVRLPHGCQMWLGRLLGRCLHRLARQRRRIAATNIRLCFPERTEAEQARLVEATFESYGMGIFETATAWLRGVDHLLARTEITGVEHVKAAQANGRGVLMIGAHFSTIDIVGALTAHYLDMDVIYRPSRNAAFDGLIQHGRRRYFSAVYSKQDTRGIIRGLRAGRAIWYAADQNYAAHHSVFAPFFGIQTATIRGTTRLVKMTGATAVFCSHYRLDNGRRYQIFISPALENFAATDETTDAERINTLIEEAVRHYPEQYLWLHRRFKTRPPGEAGFY